MENKRIQKLREKFYIDHTILLFIRTLIDFLFNSNVSQSDRLTVATRLTNAFQGESQKTLSLPIITENIISIFGKTMTGNEGDTWFIGTMNDIGIDPTDETIIFILDKFAVLMYNFLSLNELQLRSSNKN